MVTTHSRVLSRTRAIRCAIGGGLLVLAVAGCDAGDDGKKPDTSVGARQLCGGAAVSADASKALEVITGTDRFEASGKKSTLAAAAAELSSTTASTTRAKGDICAIYAPYDSRVDELRLTWNTWDTAPEGPSASKFTLFPMGDRAGGAINAAFVSFACHAENESPSEAAHITVDVQNPDVIHEPEGDPQKLKRAYVTLAHSFSLAMAKELRCADDGGLKASPSLDPA